MRPTESVKNFVELIGHEPLLTVGLGVVLPLTNPEMSEVGMHIFRCFRDLDDLHDRNRNIQDYDPRITLFQIAEAQAQDSTTPLAKLILDGVAALDREAKLRNRWRENEPTMQEIIEVKVGNVWPYQRLASQLLFKTFIHEIDTFNPFYKLAYNMQVGDDLRDVAQDLLNEQIIAFDPRTLKSIFKQDQKGNKYLSVSGIAKEHVKNIFSALYQLGKSRKLPDMNLPMSLFWASTAFSKVVTDALMTFNPINLHRIYQANRKLRNI